MVLAGCLCLGVLVLVTQLSVLQEVDLRSDRVRLSYRIERLVLKRQITNRTFTVLATQLGVPFQPACWIYISEASAVMRWNPFAFRACGARGANAMGMMDDCASVLLMSQDADNAKRQRVIDTLASVARLPPGRQQAKQCR